VPTQTDLTGFTAHDNEVGLTNPGRGKHGAWTARRLVLFNGKAIFSNAMTASLNTTILGQEVPMSQVTKALHDLWADESGKTRASLMNLAIYSEDPSSLERNTTLLGELTREHSCRALLILNVPGEAKAESRAWVTAHCQLYDGKRAVCCEQLSFVIEGGTASQVRNTVFAHLDSDLPLVVWWQGELTDRLDERFLSVIDGLIVDSSQWSQPGPSLHRLFDARAGRTSRFHLTDLAWMRSHSMRTSFANACQDAVMLASLPRMNRLSITHGAGHRMSAMMFVAWVGTQLKARLGEGMVLERKDGVTIQVEVHEGQGTCPLLGIELGNSEVKISIQREPSSSFVHASLVHPQRESETVQPADCTSDAELIGDQLSRLGGSTRYFEIKPLLLQMLEA
jgi:glucose-6-phosphate dehydrogenase assembly protein OpcA